MKQQQCPGAISFLIAVEPSNSSNDPELSLLAEEPSNSSNDPELSLLAEEPSNCSNDPELSLLAEEPSNSSNDPEIPICMLCRICCLTKYPILNTWTVK